MKSPQEIFSPLLELIWKKELLTWLGVDYFLTGNSKVSCDCSGMIYGSLNAIGCTIGDQNAAGYKATLFTLRKAPPFGPKIAAWFYGTDHIAIEMAGGMVIHAVDDDALMGDGVVLSKDYERDTWTAQTWERWWLNPSSLYDLQS
jgi:hypothetical protein